MQGNFKVRNSSFDPVEAGTATVVKFLDRYRELTTIKLAAKPCEHGQADEKPVSAGHVAARASLSRTEIRSTSFRVAVSRLQEFG